MKNCKSLGLRFDLYKCYVDDQIIVMRSIPKGWKFDRRKLVFNLELEMTDERNPIQRTAEIIADIAKRDDSNIQYST